MTEPQPVKLLPVIIGIVLTIILLAGLAYISNMRRNAPTAAPQLDILAPSANATVDSPLVIRFTSERDIRLGHNGWAAGNYHLHAHVNGVEHMPAAADLEQSGDQYAWTITAVPPGLIEIRLGWADMRHRAVVSGATDTVRATLRPQP
jgi:hypothetical protein